MAFQDLFQASIHSKIDFLIRFPHDNTFITKNIDKSFCLFLSRINFIICVNFLNHRIKFQKADLRHHSYTTTDDQTSCDLILY